MFADSASTKVSPSQHWIMALKLFKLSEVFTWHSIFTDCSSLSFLFQKWLDWVLKFPGLAYIFLEFVCNSKLKNAIHISGFNLFEVL